MTVFQYNGCFSAAKDPLPLAEQVFACFFPGKIKPVINRAMPDLSSAEQDTASFPNSTLQAVKLSLTYSRFSCERLFSNPLTIKEISRLMMRITLAYAIDRPIL